MRKNPRPPSLLLFAPRVPSSFSSSLLLSIDFTLTSKRFNRFIKTPLEIPFISVFLFPPPSGPSAPLHSLTFFKISACGDDTFERPRFSLAGPSVTLDFDARVPIPPSIFPSSYRNDTAEQQETTTETRVDTQVTQERVGREDRYTSYQQDNFQEEECRPRRREEVRFYEESDRFPRRDTRVEDIEITRDRYYDREGCPVRPTTSLEVEVDSSLDRTERDYRSRIGNTYDVEYDRVYQTGPGLSRDEYRTSGSIDIERRKMGYYDDDGNYHSFRRGVERAADRLLHPFHHRHHDRDREEVIVERDEVTVRGGGAGPAPGIRRDSVRYIERGGGPNTITIPCHFVRIGDLLILQGRICQVIRITTSAQTGQHRYLGVDLFTKQLHEESSFITNPSPSVVVQNMLGPVFKQYRVLDIRDDGYVVAMTETGDVKQNLPIIDQGHLWRNIQDSFADGRGSVRVLVINDGGRELAVDYKVIHGARL